MKHEIKVDIRIHLDVTGREEELKPLNEEMCTEIEDVILDAFGTDAMTAIEVEVTDTKRGHLIHRRPMKQER